MRKAREAEQSPARRCLRPNKLTVVLRELQDHHVTLLAPLTQRRVRYATLRCRTARTITRMPRREGLSIV